MIGNKNCVCHLFSRRFVDLEVKKPESLCFKRFLKNQKKINFVKDFLLDEGKLETESDICVGSRESICHERVISGMVCKQLEVESVAKYIISSYAGSKYFLTHNRLVNVFHQLSGNGFIVAYRKIEAEVKVAPECFLSPSGLNSYSYIIKSVSCTDN